MEKNMTIQNVIDLAVGGELKSIAVKNDVDSIINFINLGLIELYKRFQLDTKEVIYDLSNPADLNYISETMYQLPEDFMYAIAAYGEVSAGSYGTNEISINDSEDPDGIFIVSYDKVQVPTVSDGAKISIIYVANPPFFTSTNLGDRIPIPNALLEPLLHYIGYRGHGSLDGSLTTENNSHLTRFESSVNRARLLGVVTPEGISTSTRLSKGGFV